MISLIAPLFCFVALAAAQCSFNGDGISAQWQVINGVLTVQMTNKNIGNNQWTGIGFGDSMANLEVVLFPIENNKARMVTGFTKGYGPPTLDSSPNVAAEKIAYNSNQLTVRFSRPIGSNGARNSNLSQCINWNFVKQGTYNNGVQKHLQRPITMLVCPTQCTSAFDGRNVLTDPVPEAAITNNRQSNRFNGLYGQQG